MTDFLLGKVRHTWNMHLPKANQVWLLKPAGILKLWISMKQTVKNMNNCWRRIQGVFKM